MNWNAVAAVAELLGAVGVIVSLLYLATQVRQAGKMAQAVTRQALADGVQRLASDLVEVDDMARILQDHIDGKQVKPHEVLRLHTRAYRDFRFWENALFQHSQGLLTAEEWRGFRTNLKVLLQVPAYRDFWQAQQSIFSEALRSEVNSLGEEGIPFRFADTLRRPKAGESGVANDDHASA